MPKGRVFKHKCSIPGDCKIPVGRRWIAFNRLGYEFYARSWDEAIDWALH